VADVFIELLARDTGLHRAVQVGFAHRHDPVHLRQVHAHPAVNGEHMTFERCADAKRITKP
jgi:hypothetical protein